MKKIMMVLPIFALMGVIAVTSALAVSDTITVSATVLAGTPTIAIKSAVGTDLTAIALGNLPNSPTDHRTRSTEGAFVEYFPGGTFELRVWFDNYPGVDEDPNKAIAGLKMIAGTDYLPVKIWCQNFGPVDATEGPDPEDDVNWSTHYTWILERAYKVDGFGNTGLPAGYPSGIYKDDTRSVLTWKYPAGTPIRPASVLDASLPSPFRTDLAIDSAGAVPGDYSGTLTFDLTQNP